MRIFCLSCETIENGGGIYAFDLPEDGTVEKYEYFPCDRPMYAVKTGNGLCVLLRQPFADSENSGYFYVDEHFQNTTEIKSTQGVVACHLTVDEENVYVVNYLSGNIVKNGEEIVKRQGKNVHPTRQTVPHTHFVDKTPDGYLAICDLGTDTLAIYDDNLHHVSEAKVPDGYGIRHLVFSSDGNYIYAVNELVPSVSVFAYKNGKAELLETLKIECENAKANGAAIRLSADGKYLYVSIREENVICVYAVDGEKLTFIQMVGCGGDSPRDFNIFGEYLICTNEKSNNVTILQCNKGKIKEAKKLLCLNAPLCVL